MFQFNPQSYYPASPMERTSAYPSSYFPEQSLRVPAPLPRTRFSAAQLPSYGNAAAARHRYLQALADAKAAEQEMLAVEALQTEENALRRRLQEIAEQKRLSVPAGYPSQSVAFTHPAEMLSDRYQHHDLASLRHEIEMEEARQREEAEYRDLLRRKEALLRTRQASQQPGDEPVRPQLTSRAAANDACCAVNPIAQAPPKVVYQRPTPIKENIPPVPQFILPQRSTPAKETVTAAPQTETRPAPEQSSETVVIDVEELLKALFKGTFAQPTKPAPAKTESPTNELDSRLSSVNAIETSFRKLQSEFSFPAEIEFNDSPSSANPVSKLSYSSINKPVREYEQALSKLISQLDEISSHGNETLRLRRKETVLAIEKTIQDLEGEVEQRWVARHAQKPVIPEPAIIDETPESKPDTAILETSMAKEVSQVDEKTLNLTVSTVPTTIPASEPTHRVDDIEPSQSPVSPIAPESPIPEPTLSTAAVDESSAAPYEVEIDLPADHPTEVSTLKVDSEDNHTPANDSLDQSGIFGTQTVQLDEEQEQVVPEEQEKSESDWTEVEA